jgi:hypothetical protein
LCSLFLSSSRFLLIFYCCFLIFSFFVSHSFSVRICFFSLFFLFSFAFSFYFFTPVLLFSFFPLFPFSTLSSSPFFIFITSFLFPPQFLSSSQTKFTISSDVAAIPWPS